MVELTPSRTPLSLVESGKNEISQQLRRLEQRLQAGGGGGTYDGMEPRVARLEASVAHLERDVSELRSDMRDVRDRLTRLEEKVAHLPGKGFIVSSLLIGLAVIAALIAFQNQVQSFVGQSPATVESPQ